MVISVSRLKSHLPSELEMEFLISSAEIIIDLKNLCTDKWSNISPNTFSNLLSYFRKYLHGHLFLINANNALNKGCQ